MFYKTSYLNEEVNCTKPCPLVKIPCPTSMGLMDHLHWRRLRDNAGNSDSYHCTCHGHLGRCNTDRIVSIYVMPPKVAKTS